LISSTVTRRRSGCPSDEAFGRRGRLLALGALFVRAGPGQGGLIVHRLSGKPNFDHFPRINRHLLRSRQTSRQLLLDAGQAVGQQQIRRWHRAARHQPGGVSLGICRQIPQHDPGDQDVVASISWPPGGGLNNALLCRAAFQTVAQRHHLIQIISDIHDLCPFVSALMSKGTKL
jgi:hypothetical protein